jgi:hypothetical protein
MVRQVPLAEETLPGRQIESVELPGIHNLRTRDAIQD